MVILFIILVIAGAFLAATSAIQFFETISGGKWVHGWEKAWFIIGSPILAILGLLMMFSPLLLLCPVA